MPSIERAEICSSATMSLSGWYYLLQGLVLSSAEDVTPCLQAGCCLRPTFQKAIWFLEQVTPVMSMRVAQYFWNQAVLTTLQKCWLEIQAPQDPLQLRAQRDLSCCYHCSNIEWSFAKRNETGEKSRQDMKRQKTLSDWKEQESF